MVPEIRFLGQRSTSRALPPAGMRRGSEGCSQTGNDAGILGVMLLEKGCVPFSSATNSKDMNAPGWRFHKLTGDRAGFFSVSVSGNWRLVFRFVGADAVDVDYVDYH